VVPIVMNCAVPPLMPVWRWYEFGKALGAAVRSYDGLERVAVVGCGGLSHWIGNPRVGDIDEEFDRWFLDRLAAGEVDQVLDMPDEEIELAGNGNHELRTWVAVAGVMGGAPSRTLAYEPIAPWITGMGVAQWEISRGQSGNPTSTTTSPATAGE
jgi:aromatic ring-opening dioxygenase LigB subunit